MTSMLARCRCKRKSAIVGVPFADHGFFKRAFPNRGSCAGEAKCLGRGFRTVDETVSGAWPARQGRGRAYSAIRGDRD